VIGRSIALYGETDSGKTTQIVELAKEVWRARKKRTLYRNSDLGGYDSAQPLINLGIIKLDKYDPSKHDPWIWLMEGAEGKGIDDDIGLIANDGGTSGAERILDWITKDPRQIGQQKTQRFTVSAGSEPGARTLTVGANNESHYGLVQSFMRDVLWKSSWLTEKGVDVLWTFGLFKGEGVDGTLRYGPLLAGKALTPVLPKWFRYVFPLVTAPTSPGQPPRHLMYLQEQPDPLGSGGMYFANSRYPLDAVTPLPSVLEPASVVEALRLIAQGTEEAENRLKEELGL
jgi:hypothetical protein